MCNAFWDLLEVSSKREKRRRFMSGHLGWTWRMRAFQIRQKGFSSRGQQVRISITTPALQNAASGVSWCKWRNAFSWTHETVSTLFALLFICFVNGQLKVFVGGKWRFAVSQWSFLTAGGCSLKTGLHPPSARHHCLYVPSPLTDFFLYHWWTSVSKWQL